MIVFTVLLLLFGLITSGYLMVFLTLLESLTLIGIGVAFYIFIIVLTFTTR